MRTFIGKSEGCVYKELRVVVLDEAGDDPLASCIHPSVVGQLREIGALRMTLEDLYYLSGDSVNNNRCWCRSVRVGEEDIL